MFTLMPAWLQRKKSNSVGWQILESTTVPANGERKYSTDLQKKCHWQDEGACNLKNNGIAVLTGKDVATTVDRVLVIVVVREQPRVVALLDNDEGDLWLVVGLQRCTCLRDG
jgi:uncharacterized protein (UPF0548 family)